MRLMHIAIQAPSDAGVDGTSNEGESCLTRGRS